MHMIPPADAGCIATRASEPQYYRQKQRRVANGSTPGSAACVWSPQQRKEVIPVPPFAARVAHRPTSSRRATTKEPRIHKDCTGYPHAIHIGHTFRTYLHSISDQ